jgi:hypothetical protein
MRRAVELVGLEFGRMGLGRLRARELPAGDRWPGDLRGSSHHMGTTRMSDSPRTGVVDASCRVHGVENLYIAGSSVFASSGFANPTLTGATFNSVDNHSLCEFDIAATATTGGRVIANGFSGAGGTRASGAEKGVTSKIPLSVNYAGTTGDTITIAAVRVGGQNAAVSAAMEWQEIR